MTGVRAALPGVALVALAGCSAAVAPASPLAASAAPSASRSVAVSVTPAGCTARPDIVDSGVVTFAIRNQAAAQVSAVVLEQPNGLAVAEQENLTPGAVATMAVALEPGAYLIACPGATTASAVLGVVSGGEDAADALIPAGVRSFTAFLHAAAARLVGDTEALTAAVTGGNRGAAAGAYLQARLDYEQVEQFVEGSGGLDQAIDGLVVDFGSPLAATGFHRLEFAIWASRSLAGTTTIAAALLRDVRQAAASVDATSPAATDEVNAAVSSVVEAATAGVSGELEPYSGLGPAMINGDLAAARAAYAPLRPALELAGPALASTIDQRFALVSSDLQPLRAVPGADGSGFDDLAATSETQRRQIQTDLDALASALSSMATVVLQ